MENMPTIMSTLTYPHAAQAASGPCRHASLVDGRRFGNVGPLAERCAR